MKTVKVIHYPERGNKTTEIFEADKVKVVEGYLHEILDNKIDEFFDKQSKYNLDLRTFGAEMCKPNAHQYWVIWLYLDDTPMLAGLNSKVYVMVDGKTVASYESFYVE